MGGRNSGTWYRWDSKDTCEAQHRVDVRFMRKQGMLFNGAAGNLSWTCRGEPSGNINYRVANDTLILSYKHRRHRDAEWESVEQRIPILSTPCNYGGKRYWWQCPPCGRRVAVLYGAGKYFLCRNCHNLSYASQQESKADRLSRKVDKIKVRLGGSKGLFNPIPPKPKGMHRLTYWRLCMKAYNAEKQALGMLSRQFGFHL